MLVGLCINPTTLLLSAAKDMCSVMTGEAAKLNLIPMTDNDIQCCSSDTASDVTEQLLDCDCESPFFSIQLDESTDVANCARPIVYAVIELLIFNKGNAM